jgi:hypothetical protein
MRKTTIALFALAAVGLVQPTVVSARGGAGGFGGGGLPRQLRRQLCGRGRRLPPSWASRHDAPRLANTTSSGLQLIRAAGPPAGFSLPP